MNKNYLIALAIFLIVGTAYSQTHFQENRELTETEINALFDIFIEVPEDFHEIFADEELFSTIKLVNLGSAGRIDVFLDYEIINEKGDLVLDQRETIAVETQATIVREFDLTGNPPGDYVLQVKLTYADGRFAETQHSFKIQKQDLINRNLIIIIIIMILIIGIIGILIYKSRPLIEKILVRSRVKKIVKEKTEKSN